jgi:asparagine synthase (glutamine-hydrolysing)
VCGLTGIWTRDSACDPGTLTAMRDLLAHRGPDGSGNFIEGGLGLGHRRLSIIDVGGGHQPMQTPDGRFTIVYNGEIYNYPQLRQELESRGAVFRTRSDTEVILQLHALDGDAGVERLNGIFAYALWDRQEHKLLLVRDRAGIKPLYYAQTPRGIVFGSEIKSLFASGLVAPSLDAARLPEFLVFRQIAGPDCLFAGVKALEPGGIATVRDARIEGIRRYWSVTAAPRPFSGGFQAAVDALDSTLNSAVKRQLMSEVPLGTFCSGGIDSSLTTAIAQRHSSIQVNTFSVGFDEADYDESEFAGLAARHCGTRHHTLRIGEARYAELLPTLIWHHDLPLNFANSVHIYAVSALARQHVTVVLTGEGADELFGGYPRYYVPRIADALRSLPALLRLPAQSILKLAGGHRMEKILRALAVSREDALIFNSTGIAPETAQGLLGNAPVTSQLAFRRACAASALAAGLPGPEAMGRLDFQTYLVSILNRQDKMSMATSIEARVPFLDNEIIDFARSLPADFKQTLRQRKRVLQEVALRYLPASIVHRRKSGFGVPLAPWFRGNGPMSALLDAAVNDAGTAQLLAQPRLRELRDAHRAGRADHSEILWSVLNLHLWKQRFNT